MKAGMYYVGDLCYVLDDSWEDVCSVLISDLEVKDGVFALPDGRQFASFGTAYGDGTYSDQFGNEYDVDSGSIGCILIEDIPECKIEEGMQVWKMEEEFTPCVTGEGVLNFGPIIINTAEDEDDSDEWDDEDFGDDWDDEDDYDDDEDDYDDEDDWGVFSDEDEE